VITRAISKEVERRLILELAEFSLRAWSEK
jgi:hypothetical protein